MPGLEYPRTILTDKEDGLIAAIESVFPTTKSMVCIWHVFRDWEELAWEFAWEIAWRICSERSGRAFFRIAI
jgi:transposase-like protein